MVSYEKRNGLSSNKVLEKKNDWALVHWFFFVEKKRLLEMPSFQMVNRWYDQSYSEVLAFKDEEISNSLLHK